jgi:hypothetical protein
MPDSSPREDAADADGGSCTPVSIDWLGEDDVGGWSSVTMNGKTDLDGGLLTATVTPNGSGWAFLEKSVPSPGPAELRLDFRMRVDAPNMFAHVGCQLVFTNMNPDASSTATKLDLEIIRGQPQVAFHAYLDDPTTSFATGPSTPPRLRCPGLDRRPFPGVRERREGAWKRPGQRW